MKLKEKLNIDVYRFIAAIMIVAIHIYPFSFINEDLDYIITRVIFRICVPLFLMITGYYIIKKSLKDIKILKNYTIKILKLYFISMIIFLPINIYNHYFTNNTLITIIKDILINGTFYHLWYFPALLLGIWVTYFLIKHFKDNTVKIVLILLFIIGLFGDNYYGIVKNIPIIKNFYNIIFSVSSYTRNGLFYTPIFIYIGYIFNNKTNKLTYKKNIIYIFVMLLLMTIEGIILHFFSTPKHSSMYIFLIPLSYFIFNFIIFYSKGENKVLRKYSSWIYIL